ncbi:MAG: T9SS type A sorting domain-containing protein [Bacteroidales bacterium]|nr:T9SS type A sorting domain-containing protein [Bacteroidales bacterium]
MKKLYSISFITFLTFILTSGFCENLRAQNSAAELLHHKLDGDVVHFVNPNFFSSHKMKNTDASYYNDSVYMHKWNSESDNWYLSLRIKYNYEQGNMILKLIDSWDTTANEWVFSSKEEFSYDGAGHNDSSVYYYWDKIDEVWVKDTKAEVLFDLQYNDSVIFYYLWDESKINWVNDSKMELFYDISGNDSCYYSSIWSTDQNQWNPMVKGYYYYVQNNILDTVVRYIWSSSLTDWKYFLSDKVKYDVTGKKSEVISYSWDSQSELWNLSRKAEYSYDKLNLLETTINYNWSSDANDWNNSYKYQYYWSQHSELGVPELTVVPGIKIYPNPFADKVNILITNSTEKAFDYEIINSAGQVLASKQNCGVSESHQIDLKKYPTGFYFVKIKTGNIFLVQKIVKR